LKKCPLIWKNFSTASLKKLAGEMEATTFNPGDVVFEEGDFLQKNLYLIHEGIIHLVDRTGRIIHVLKGGECFGERLFFAE
jgi:signal-transduction protein with cAMP-binding, CBS, and nucleotidyltransferase domain